MEDRPAKFIWMLTLRVEMYIYLIVIPNAIFFVMAVSQFHPEKLFVLLINGVLASAFTLIIGTIIRFSKLLPMLRSIDKKDTDLVELKKKLLDFPKLEGIIMVCRWVVGLFVAYVLIEIQIDLIFLETLGIILCLVISAPISYILSYFSAERYFQKIQNIGKLRSIIVPSETFTKSGIIKRTLLMLVSIITLPTVILGYYFYLTNLHEIQFGNFSIHFVILLILSAILIIAAIYESSSTTKYSYNTTLNQLREISKGNLSGEFIPTFSRTEFGIISQAVNGLSLNLKNTLFGFKNISAELETHRASLLTEIEQFNILSATQAASLDEISSSIEQMQSIVQKSQENAFQAQKLGKGISDELKSVIDSFKETGSVIDTILEKIEFIRNITEQTDMLALNATIESSRAEEYGEGFAVVAEEILKLSEGTKTNTDEILAIMEKSKSAAVKSSQILAKTFPRVVGLSSQINKIQQSSNSQTTGIQQLNKAILSLNEMASIGLNTLEELRSHSKTFKEQNQRLEKITAYFTLEKGQDKQEDETWEEEIIRRTSNLIADVEKTYGKK